MSDPELGGGDDGVVVQSLWLWVRICKKKWCGGV